MRARSVLVPLALSGAVLVPATHAFAAPITAPTTQTFSGVVCSDGNTYTVVANSGQSGNNNNQQVQTWNPGFIISGGSGPVIPTQFTFSATQNGAPIFSQTVTKGNGQTGPQGTPVTCTIDFGPVPLPSGGTGDASLTVTGVRVGH